MEDGIHLALPTNRDHHFANTTQFREAVRVAKDVNGTLLLGDLFELLCATHPDWTARAFTELLTSGVSVVDARTGWIVANDARALQMIASATAVGRERRAPILRGLVRRQKPADAEGETNQASAARGASLASSLDFERRLRPICNLILRDLPNDTTLSRSRLAAALNARNVLTRQGKTWTPANAGKLLSRLSAAGLTRDDTRIEE